MTTTESIFLYALFIGYLCVLFWWGSKVTKKQNELFAKHGVDFRGRGRYAALEKIMTPEEQKELTVIGTRFAKYAGYGFLIVAGIMITVWFLR
jgi:Ca2+/Na+ antiporter